jgi:N-acetylneuraminate synthase
MNPLFKDLFIFEMANNHQGSLDHGMAIIRAMGEITRRTGARAAVKFQYRDLDTFIHPQYRERQDLKHIPRFLGTRLSWNEYQAMVQAVRAEGMVTMCTPFDEPSVGVIQDHGIQVIKVASCSATDWPLLAAVAKAGRPVIVSTAGQTLVDIDNTVSFLSHRSVDFALLHCCGLYPAPPPTIQMNFLERLRMRFPGVPVGYSGHEAPQDLDVVKVAVAKGAVILERHVGLPTETVRLNAYSSDPPQTEAWVRAGQAARILCGATLAEKAVGQEERESLRSLARGTWAARDLVKGEKITRQDVFFAMPCLESQTTSGEYLESMVASRDYVRNGPLQERRPPSLVHMAREIVHAAKGLLNEAQVNIGDDFEGIELSHHHGLEHFREYGALIVNLVNRAYCKKLIVMMPGQRHPTHRHQIKEETFHLLWGDLEMNLDGVTMLLKPGSKLLVERGARHSFSSRGGAVLEEISTTHVKGDSIYDDERINQRDMMERKTVIEEW